MIGCLLIFGFCTYGIGLVVRARCTNMQRLIAGLVALGLVAECWAADTQLSTRIDVLTDGSFRGGSNRTVATLDISPTGAVTVSSGGLTRRTRSVLLAATPEYTLHGTGEGSGSSYLVPQGTDETYAYAIDYQATGNNLWRRELVGQGGDDGGQKK